MAMNSAKSIAAAFGVSCGMPFLTLANGNSAAVQLANGIRFELEYIEAEDIFFLHATIGPVAAFSLNSLMRISVALYSGHGVSLGIADIAGNDSVVAMTRVPVDTVDTLVRAANKVVETALYLVPGNESGGAPERGREVHAVQGNWLPV